MEALRKAEVAKLETYIRDMHAKLQQTLIEKHDLTDQLTRARALSPVKSSPINRRDSMLQQRLEARAIAAEQQVAELQVRVPHVPWSESSRS